MKLLVAICFVYFLAAVDGNLKIAGGKNASDGQYPYMVALSGYTGFFCGGSIINNRWILTAAHCVRYEKNNSVGVTAGTILLKGGKEQYYQSEYIVYHENYDKPRHSNDVGLIRVNKDIEFNDKVQPVKLPKTDIDEIGLPVVISGWGSTKLSGDNSNNLQELSQKIFDQKTCKSNMSDIVEINHSHICAFAKYGQGICHRDSGGPLVTDGFQIGIASLVRPCAVGYPDVYTRVYTFVNWIAAQQKKFQNDSELSNSVE